MMRLKELRTEMTPPSLRSTSIQGVKPSAPCELSSVARSRQTPTPYVKSYSVDRVGVGVAVGLSVIRGGIAGAEKCSQKN